MSEYRTFVLHKENFTVNPCLENVQFSTEADENLASYVIRAKIRPETPFVEVLDLLKAGMSLTVRIASKSYKLELSEIAEQLQSCIVVKGKQFEHQFVYDGPGDGRHCVFCQQKQPYGPTG
jgi:hypothetical protein